MNLFVLHERGVALFGPPAAEVFPRVSMQQMREASLRSLHEEWKPLLVNDSLLDDPHYQAYITLTLCRILHTQQADGETIRHTVERAEQWAVGQPLDMKREVLALLRFTLAEIGRIAANGPRALNSRLFSRVGRGMTERCFLLRTAGTLPSAMLLS